MKLIRIGEPGAERPGALVGEGTYVDLADVTADFNEEFFGSGGLDRIRPIVEQRAARGQTSEIGDQRVGAPIARPHQILCIGLNYASHVGEVGRQVPVQPSVFSRLHNTLVAHGGDIVRPRASIAFDFEGELAIVIGERCRHVSRASALSVIAGYTCFLDGSVRDFQKHSVIAGKNFPATGPLGPWMVTTDVITDPQRLELTTRLNDTVVQHDTTDHMIFDVATIIEYLSTVTWLEPGDIIATGTPDGVGTGRKPPLWMKPGDKVDVEISGIGTLSVNVVDE